VERPAHHVGGGSFGQALLLTQELPRDRVGDRFRRVDVVDQRAQSFACDCSHPLQPACELRTLLHVRQDGPPHGRDLVVDARQAVDIGVDVGGVREQLFEVRDLTIDGRRDEGADVRELVEERALRDAGGNGDLIGSRLISASDERQERIDDRFARSDAPKFPAVDYDVIPPRPTSARACSSSPM
jgi:hypothetical protein